MGRRGPHWIAAYRDLSDQVDVSSPRGQVALQEMLAEARNRTDPRRERLTEDTTSVPLLLWIVLGLGGAVAVVLQLAMADRQERSIVQATMITGVASIVAAGLVVVNFLDHPYAQRIGGIKPAEMHQTLQVMHQTSPTVPLPCNAAGEPSRA